MVRNSTRALFRTWYLRSILLCQFYFLLNITHLPLELTLWSNGREWSLFTAGRELWNSENRLYSKRAPPSTIENNVFAPPPNPCYLNLHILPPSESVYWNYPPSNCLHSNSMPPPFSPLPAVILFEIHIGLRLIAKIDIRAHTDRQTSPNGSG